MAILKPKELRKRSPEFLYISAMHEFNAPDYSSTLPHWAKFVYINLPNNWLKMHGYPMRRRLKQ